MIKDVKVIVSGGELDWLEDIESNEIGAIVGTYEANIHHDGDAFTFRVFNRNVGQTVARGTTRTRGEAYCLCTALLINLR